eukprot:9529759-Karenia_brevis.AAC.1
MPSFSAWDPSSSAGAQKISTSSNGLGALMAMMSMPFAATTPCGSCLGWYAGLVNEILRSG